MILNEIILNDFQRIIISADIIDSLILKSINILGSANHVRSSGSIGCSLNYNFIIELFKLIYFKAGPYINESIL